MTFQAQSPAIISAFPVLLILILIVVLYLAIFQPKARHKEAYQQLLETFHSLPDVLPLEGAEIPVQGWAVGGSLKRKIRIGPRSAPHNTINPTVMLYDDRIAFGRLGSRSLNYSDVKQLDVYGDDKHFKLTRHKRGGAWMAYVPEGRVLTEVVAFLHKKGLPLGEEARRLIGQP